MQSNNLQSFLNNTFPPKTYHSRKLTQRFLRKLFGSRTFAVGLGALLAALSPCISYSDYTFSENTTLTEDFTDTGKVTIASDVTVDTNGFNFSFANIGTTGTITNSNADSKSIVTMKNTVANEAMPLITGNLDFHHNSTIAVSDYILIPLDFFLKICYIPAV